MDARSSRADPLPHFIVLIQPVAEPLHILHRCLKFGPRSGIGRDSGEVVGLKATEHDEVGLDFVD